MNPPILPLVEQFSKTAQAIQKNKKILQTDLWLQLRSFLDPNTSQGAIDLMVLTRLITAKGEHFYWTGPKGPPPCSVTCLLNG